MKSAEIRKQFNMSYDELVRYLLKKYGKAQYDYFVNESCKSRNPKVMRTDEGLHCHHIDGNKVDYLSSEKLARENSFEHQKADRLVYCNAFEHLILHIKITPLMKNGEFNWVNPVFKLCEGINDFYSGYEFKQKWRVVAFDLIKNNFEDYVLALIYILNSWLKYLPREDDYDAVMAMLTNCSNRKFSDKLWDIINI